MEIITDENGFIVTTGLNLDNPDHTYDGDKNIEPADPSNTETAWHWNNGNPELRSTGANIIPDPEEAKNRLFDKAKTDWNMNRGQVRNLIKNYALYEFLDGKNYGEAKLEATDAYDAGDITQAQRDWIHDMLDGVI